MRYLGMAVLSVAVMLALSGAAMGNICLPPPGQYDYVNAQYTTLGGYYDSSLSVLGGRAYVNGKTGDNWDSLGRMLLVKDGNSGGGPIVNALGVSTPYTGGHGYGSPAPLITAYCLSTSLLVTEWTTHTYQVKTLDDGVAGPYSYGLSAQKANDLTLWFNLFEPVVTAHQDSDRATSLGKPHVNKYGPAFQAGVWEIVKETSGTYDAQAGTFTCVTGPIRLPVADWTPYMDFNALTAGWFTQFAAVKAAGVDYANLYPVYAFDPTDGTQPFVFMVVPEPVTMAGVLLGIGCLATYLRKRRLA